ncbi:MAG TPA: choice-of-anchor D domain-containing protein [Steroidobacteraceae bacterium]|nr:choice-of-anchor D domain-containing protein [Steroidobacteraceae bacterium]
MQLFTSKASWLLSGLAASVLLLASEASLAQTVNLTAAPTSTTLPDGQNVPMWGYQCGPADTGSTPATCAAANTNAGPTWSPIVITVPYNTSGATSLTINLTNSLTFPAGSGSNTLPTSIVIVGQLGGGLELTGSGSHHTTSTSPVHAPQGATWPVIGGIDSSANSVHVTAGGSGYTSAPVVTLSGDGSGATAVANINASGAVTSITLTNAGSGYTSAPTVGISGGGGAGAAATVDFVLFSTAGTATALPPAQLPRVQSFGTEAPFGATTKLTWNNLRPGTYLIESGTHPSIQAPMGLYGILVVTTGVNGTAAGQAYPTTANVPATKASAYDADLPVILSEIDPVQNAAVAAAVATAGFKETNVWSGQPGACGDPSSTQFNTCYPPAVNYSPRYYLVNGVSFDRTNLGASTASILKTGTTVAPPTGNVLVRLVNAGLRMHVPSIVGLPMTLIAEDGNALPGMPRLQNEVFLAAGKTYDIVVNPTQTAGAYSAATYPLFDRQLSLSTNNQRDGGMQSYISIAGGATSGVGASGTSAGGVNGSDVTLNVAAPPPYLCVNGTTLSVSDPLRGLLGGTTGANGVALFSKNLLPGSTLVLQPNGTFTYTPPATGTCAGSFQFVVNNSKTPITATIAECDASSGSSAAMGCTVRGAPQIVDDSFNSSNAQQLVVSPPGVLLNDADPAGLPLTVDVGSVKSGVGLTNLIVNPDGSFTALASGPGTYSFTYNVKNSQQTPGSQMVPGTSTNPPTAQNYATVTLNFPAGSGLKVKLLDKDHGWELAQDYRWVIEEDRTFWIDPKCQINTGVGARPKDSYGRDCPLLPVEALGYNFHSAGMPVVATGCVGSVSCEQGQTVLGQPAVCDGGDGTCRTTDLAGNPLPLTAARIPLDPGQVALDPNKHYFISVMPGDGINPTVNGAGGPVTVGSATRQFAPLIDCPTQADFAPGTGACGHNMGGAQIGPQFDAQHGTVAPVATMMLAETPLPTAKIAILVYEDDFPLNGENDAGGGVDIIAPNEPGLGGFQIELYDQAGALGDNTGQITYDMFNMPLSNSLAGTKDPISGLDACPIASNPDGIAAMVVTCPTYESDGKTMSPLAGQAVIANLYPGIYEPQAFPAADRIARGEEWLQTNTLDGGKPHEAFVRPGEPAYFQEFGPGGFHVQIGFANPKFINDRRSNSAGTGLCDPLPAGGGMVCKSTVTGHVHGNHMSRTPDERTYDTETYDAFKFSNCYASLGIPDQQDFAFAKCDADGNFSMSGLPDGIYKLAVFDQWNDIMLDGLVTAVAVNGDTPVTVTATQWRTNLYTRTYLDMNGNGIPDRDANGNDKELGATLVPIKVRYRDGSIGFANTTDLNGYATYNEVFPFMNWLVVEPDTTRYKQTGQHVVYDAGGPDDCTASAPACSNTAAHLASTTEYNSLPPALQVPGAVYCPDADCSLAADSIKNSPYYNGTLKPAPSVSSGRIDPPWKTEAWQGLLGQHSFIDFGMKPFLPGETGGIQGLVVYSSTRPFDDPGLLIQLTWEPAVPNVRVNLYKEDVATDGTKTLTLVDTTLTSSWDAWSQGFRTNGDGKTPLKASVADNSVSAANDGLVPNMNCPGQDPSSGFFATLAGSKMWLDSPAIYDANGHITNPNKNPLAYKSQFKCFDGWSMLNQIQPGPYDGKYVFPSIVDRDPKTGKPSGQGQLNGVPTGTPGTNCSICKPNIVDANDPNPVLPPGKYVVEVVTPPGYEVVKEEDKNILMGDIYVAPVTQQFAGLGNVFILPDQAAMNAYYNANNAVNPTTNLGVANPREDFASTDQLWPCVGQMRVVPDVMSLFPAVGQTAPFAGASRPLCDRKEITLHDQDSVSAKFYIFTKNHVAGHFVGGMTNDMASEFDPFSPQFGEKFGVPNLPIRMRDFVGDEVTRVYADQWGAYNGLYFSSWEVNPPNPTGYAPQMSVACMNDPGPILDNDPTSATYQTMITDPAYNPAYSNFCYETPFMPGFTAYMDTPVTPTQAFADHYNLPDAEYPDNTPVIKRADFDKNSTPGPWAAGSAAVSKVTLTRNGSGYSTVPSVSFNGGGGSGASGVATMAVNAVAITSASGYTSAPGVSFTGGGGSGATATACVGVTSFTVTAGGTGYNNRPNVTLTGGGAPNGSRATARATVSGGKVTAVTLTGQGSGCGYTAAPTVSFNGGGGTGAAATASINLASINVSNGGTGYTGSPTVAFSAGNAKATASLSVNGVTLTNGGSAYTSAPTVAFSGNGGAAATSSIGGVTTSLQLVLKSLGDRVVQNPQFAGPSAAAPPYNSKTITRHYGFGTQCTAIGANCLAVSGVTVGGLKAGVTYWDDKTINVTVPSGLQPCPVQQLNVTAPAVCGEVVVTAGNGKQTIDGITVTLGGKAPTVVTPSSPTSNKWGEFYPNPLQTAIDKAVPGDLIMVEAGSYRENLIMWKPVRLQGVGAAVVTINGDAQPAGKMDAWRRRVSCLFGLTIQGGPLPAAGLAGYDPAGQYSCPAEMYFRADRIPFEGFVGWDAASNGNLAQVLQEPSLMGAYEGASITVIGRGVNQVRSGERDLWGQSIGGGSFADGSRYVNGSSDCRTATKSATVDDYGTGNYLCNPSSIDGFSILNSSQGGGGIFMHGWGHNMQIANNRISANAGTLSGGINLGNGETAPSFILDNTICFANPGLAPNPAPLCPPLPQGVQIPVNGQIPFQFNTNVRIHHNQILDNASIGDALFSGTPAGAGGVTISAGSDFYQLDHNWIAANLTSSDGGGVAQMGVSFNGNISNNFVLFNQANNPTLPVDGGGIIIMGAQEDRTLASGQECGGTTDLDCPPGMSDGTGPGLVIDSNLILGNSAEDGSGGGLRLRQTNGNEVVAFETQPQRWYGVTVTNNIIVNNVAGWDGGGVSLQDSFKTVFVNNTVASNDTTASAGVLFKTLGAIDAASPPPGCLPTPDPTQPQSPNCMLTNGPHIPQPAGLVTMQNTPNLMAQLKGTVNCPKGFGYGDAQDSSSSLANGRCILVSLPSLVNDMFWQNRAFSVEIVGADGKVVKDPAKPTGTGLHDHQNIIALVPTLNQSFTGQCPNPPFLMPDGTATQLYWDLGVRMDGLPDTNGHNLVFNSATVGTGYTLEAAATAQIKGSVTAITIASGGSGYTSAPTVTLVNGDGAGATATATITPDGVVNSIDVTTAGSGYTSNPNVVFSGGGGSGAIANSTITGSVSAVTRINPGAGYTSLPTVTLDPPQAVGGVQATAKATWSPATGQVTGFTLLHAGSGYTSAPSVTITGGGITANGNNCPGTRCDLGPIALTATNSILSDQVNLLNINSVAGAPNVVPASAPVQGQYCNGARIPPEQCSTNQGANDIGMCMGYFAPVGQSETFGVAPVFSFNGIKASATVDEGNNWINMTYGPLSLGRPVTGNGSFNAEPIVASAPVAAASGAYTIIEGSAAIDAGANVGSITTHDFFGQPRSQGSATDIGAVELAPQPVDLAITKSADTSNVLLGGTVHYTVTASNASTATVVGARVIDTLPSGVTATWTCTATGGSSCGSASGAGSITATNGGSVTLAGGGGVTFSIAATLGAAGSVVNSATVTAPAGYIEANTANNLAQVTVTVTAPPSVTGGPLNFGSVNDGNTSAAQTLTLHNTTGNSLSGIAIGLTAPYSRLTGGAGDCTTTLAAGATCTIKVIFAPTTPGAHPSTATVTATSTTFSGAPVALTGNGVALVVSATLTPTSNNFGGVRTGRTATQTFVLKNTGTVPLTNITQGAVGGLNSTEFGIFGLLSSCGPAGGGQFLSITSLAPNAFCNVTVQFRPQTTGAKSGTVSVSYSGGSQTSTLSGTGQ